MQPICQRKLQKLVDYRSNQMQTDTSDEEWAEALNVFFGRMLKDVQADLEGKILPNYEKLSSLKQKLQSILENVSTNDVESMEVFMSSLAPANDWSCSDSKSNLVMSQHQNSPFGLISSALANKIQTQLSKEQNTENDNLQHKLTIERIFSSNTQETNIEDLLYVKDRVLKSTTKEIDTLAEACRLFLMAKVAKETNLNDISFTESVKKTTEVIKSCISQANFNKSEIDMALMDIVTNKESSADSILQVFNGKTAEKSDESKKSISLDEYRSSTIITGLVSYLFAQLEIHFEEQTKLSSINQRRTIYTKQSQFHGISAKWNLTSMIRNDANFGSVHC